MVDGVAKTDYFLWENKQKVSRGELMGSIASLQTQNSQLHLYITQLKQDNVILQHKILQVEEDNTKLLGNNEGVKIEYKQLHDYTTKLYNDFIKLDKDYNLSKERVQTLEQELTKKQKELTQKQECYTNVFDQQQKKYKAIAETLEKYKTAKTLMYDVLEYILSFSSTDTSDKISDTLSKVYKLVTPVYRGDTQETPNKL
jgi:chromosome segregation ATPase